MIVQGSFASLLGGVSQQIPRQRIAGQLSIQENMLSDQVTGLRRRPGIPLVQSITGYNTTPETARSLYVEVGAASVNLFVNSTTGQVHIFDTDFVLKSTVQHNYLIADNINKIRVTSIAGSLWLLNTDKKPVLGGPDTTKLNPVYEGFFYIRTGAFQKTYQIRVEYGGGYTEFTYTTDSTASNSTPEGVATNLYNLMTANTGFMLLYDVYRNGAYIYLTRRNKSAGDASQTTVTSTSGQQYISCSGGMQLALASDLPSKLPTEANNTIVAVGSSPTAMAYFRWDNTKAAWAETSSYTSPKNITNMPLKLEISDSGVGALTAPAFKGRTAGDENNNPSHTFTTKGLTGISSFQGRLVLFSGAYVSMSSSQDVMNFYRTTVTQLLPSDPIEVGSGSLTAAAFEYGVQFNKDLVLIAKSHQAVIPTGNTAITPSNALVVMTSAEALDTTAAPAVIGRTIMGCSPISGDYYGILEMVPSAYTDSQYVPQNLTEHIPRFMRGRTRHIVGSSISSIALFTSSVDFKRILVHEYVWDGDQRRAVAWHGWTLPLDIVTLHFARDRIIVGLKSGNDLLICSIDPRASTFLGNITRPYLDCYSFATVVGNKVTVPTHLRNPALASSLMLAQSTGDLAGEPVGIASINTNTWEITTVRSFVAGDVAIGWKFTSQMAPTPPMMRDRNDVVISTSKTTILKYIVTTQRSGEFEIDVIDNSSPTYSEDEASTLTWSSRELQLGEPKVAGLGTVVVPCRTVSHTTDMILSTSGTRELNILDMEYVLKTEVRNDRKRL